MSLAWLEVPVPDGDLEAMNDAADVLASIGRRIDDGADHVVRIGSAVGQAWDSEAGRAFRRQQATARQAVGSLAAAHAGASAQVRAYATEWEHARRASERARDDIEDALHAYASAARGALEDVAGLLGRVLDNPVADVLGHVVPLVHELQQRLHAWQAPGASPYLTPVPVSPLRAVGEEHVLDQLRGAGEWAVSRVLDGIEGVLGLVERVVGGAIHTAIGLVHAVERTFAAAVVAAQTMARAALRALADAAVRAALGVRAVIEGLTIWWALTVEWTEQQVQALVELGKDLLAALYLGYEIAAALLGLAVVLSRVQNPLELLHLGERRVGDGLDEEAFNRFYTDAQWRQHVVDLADLAASSYHSAGAPKGWTRLETIDGPEGFAAAVYRDASGHVVVAFRGSEGSPFDVRDWSQDSLNAADLPTAQGAWAIRTAKQLESRYPHMELTGHSLGGSLASTASIATGAPTVTFNAAGVGGGNHTAAVLAGAGVGSSEKQITNFSTSNDVLTLLQRSSPVYAAAGAQVTLSSNTGNPASAHGLDAFEEFERIREGAR